MWCRTVGRSSVRVPSDPSRKGDMGVVCVCDRPQIPSGGTGGCRCVSASSEASRGLAQGEDD